MTEPLKVAVVTGASRGIGRAVALRFAQEGYEVWALARSGDALEKLSQDATALFGGKIHALSMDAQKHDELLAACATVLARGPVPSVLVNNAGIAVSSPLGKTRLEDYERTMAVNATAPFLMCRELVPAMVKAGGGRVINIGSTASIKGFKYTAAYCASKHALLGLTRALAAEFAAHKVTVNAVCPGWTDTDLLESSAQRIAQATGKTRDEARQTLAKMNPMGRLVTPEEVAELCFFLSCPAAAAVTGAAYLMDAGETV